jgi:hypothetical protein
MLSSSCSYAATAMAKSLFAKGADFVTAMIFMVASTNLVVEMGLVLIVLMGWQFAAAEFVGGPIMIVLLAWWGTQLFPDRLTRPVRQRLQQASDSSSNGRENGAQESLASKLRQPATWANAARYTMADLTMLQKELLIGFLVAGLLTAAVPDAFWQVVFIQGNGFWTSLQNALIGPLIAVLSFVCSIGNIALAASLWKGGISFGGVIAFIFADLITLPLLLIYHKYYGPRLAWRLFIGLWLVMSTSGLIVEGLFNVAGLIPAVRQQAGQTHGFEWNSTTWLNLTALVVLGIAWTISRNKERFGGAAGYAIDPICGMQVEIASAPASRSRNGERFWFCSDNCAEAFDHRKVDSKARTAQSWHHTSLEAGVMGLAVTRDPVCGMGVTSEHPGLRRQHADQTLLFCSQGCASRFDARPSDYVQQSRDPICGMEVDVKPTTRHRQNGETHAWFCGPRCAGAFDARS